MSNEMKLITALCEALGFEVEQSLDYRRSTVKAAANTFSEMSQAIGFSGYRFIEPFEEFTNKKEKHGTELIDPVITYKLIPKAPTGEER